MSAAGNSPSNSGPWARIRLRYALPAIALAVVLALAVVAVITVSSNPKLHGSSDALADVAMPFGGGTVERVVVLSSPEQSVVPTTVRGDEVWPSEKLKAGEKVKLEVTVKRPGWISWLSGKTDEVTLTETTPTPVLASRYITRHSGQAVLIKFDKPISKFAYDSGSKLTQEPLSKPVSDVALDETASAGDVEIVTAVRSWEKPTYADISWFPAGAKATAVATPAPGSSIDPTTDITLTFSEPVSKALGSSMPPVSPRTEGTWHKLNAHTIRFEPEDYGYGLDAQVSVSLPAGVTLVGGQEQGSDPIGKWTVASGTTARLQQLLAQLGYLPVNFTQTGTAVPDTTAAQETAAITPPTGTYSWRYANTPSTLKSMWSPGNWDELSKGAVMAFEEDNGLDPDGIPGPDVWKALIADTVAHKASTFGYTFVHVSETEPENITVWHNGKDVVQGLANTGIPAAPTATGTYAVYEHIPSGTMSGTNPNGTPYHDVGIPDISYFNGGDALHGFIRSSYGFPQSLGCVEMPYSEAAEVYPYTPVGTIVNIVS